MSDKMVGHSSGPVTFTWTGKDGSEDELIFLIQRMMTNEEFAGIKNALPKILDTHDAIGIFLGDCVRNRAAVYKFLKEQHGKEAGKD